MKTFFKQQPSIRLFSHLLAILSVATVNLSHGAPPSIQLVKDIQPGSSGSSDPYYDEGLTMLAIGDTLYFSATDGTNGRELWTSDGTESGTVMLKNLRTTPTYGSDPYLIGAGDNFFILATSNTNDNVLFFSDGTELGTIQITSNSEPTDSQFPYYDDFYDILYFSGRTSTEGQELWKTDGSIGGTSLVKDIISGTGWSRPVPGVSINGNLFFYASGDPTSGGEPWRSDGTSAGTALLKDVNPGLPISSAKMYSNLDGTLLFTAYDSGSNNWKLWKSDGTTGGTVLVRELIPDTSIFTNHWGSIPIGDICVYGSNGYFIVQYRTNTLSPIGYELWKTDGTYAGTVKVKILRNGSGSVSAPEWQISGGKVYFTFHDRVHGYELWTTDGTEAGTKMIKDLRSDNVNATTGGSNPEYLTDMNGTLFFVANTSEHGREIWKSDGTESGTVIVEDYFPGTTGSNPFFLTDVNGSLFFFATPATGIGAELHSYDVPNPPIITPSQPSNIAYNSATLSGTINPNAFTTTAFVEYGLTDAYGSSEPIVLSQSDGTDPVSFLVNLSGLDSNTEYHYRYSATSSDGTTLSSDLTFTTLINLAPNFTGHSDTTSLETSLEITFATLLNGVTDPEGHSFQITSIETTSEKSGSITTDASSLTYTPAAGVWGNDSFSVTVTDEFSASVTREVSITITLPEGMDADSLSNPLPVEFGFAPETGDPEMFFYGVPGRVYALERSENLNDWDVIASVTAAADGKVYYLDLEPPADSAFYRRTSSDP